MAEPRNTEVKPFAIVKPENRFQVPGALADPDLSKSRPVHAFSTKAPLASSPNTVDLRPQSVPVDVDLSVPKATEATTPTVDSSATASASSSETDSSANGSTPEKTEAILPSSQSESPEGNAVAEKVTHEIEPELEDLPAPSLEVRPGMAFTTLPLPPVPSS